MFDEIGEILSKDSFDGLGTAVVVALLGGIGWLVARFFAKPPQRSGSSFGDVSGSTVVSGDGNVINQSSRDPDDVKLIESLNDQLREKDATLTEFYRTHIIVREQRDSAIAQLSNQRVDAQRIIEAETEILKINPEPALQIYKEVADRELAKASDGDRSLVVQALRRQGALASIVDTNRALSAYERATEIDPADIESWLAIGELRHLAADFEGAMDAYEKAKALSQVGDSPLFNAIATSYIAQILVELKEPGRALTANREALELYESVERSDYRQQGISLVSHNIGNLLLMAGQVLDAEAALRNALEIDEARGDRSGVASDLGMLGAAWLSIAVQFRDRALSVPAVREVESRSGIKLPQGEEELVLYAKDYLVRSLEIHEELDDKPKVAAAQGNLGQFYLQFGDEREAYSHLEKSIAISRRLGAMKSISDASEIYARALAQTGEKRAAISVLDSAIRDCATNRPLANHLRQVRRLLNRGR